MFNSEQRKMEVIVFFISLRSLKAVILVHYPEQQVSLAAQATHPFFFPAGKLKETEHSNSIFFRHEDL